MGYPDHHLHRRPHQRVHRGGDLLRGSRVPSRPCWWLPRRGQGLRCPCPGIPRLVSSDSELGRLRCGHSLVELPLVSPQGSKKTDEARLDTIIYIYLYLLEIQINPMEKKKKPQEKKKKKKKKKS